MRRLPPLSAVRVFEAAARHEHFTAADDENLLSISTTSTFANTWLAWRLGGFQMEHPQLAVKLDANNALIDFASSDVDVAIRAGEGEWPGLDATRLFEIDYTPICSPRFLSQWQAEHGG